MLSPVLESHQSHLLSAPDRSHDLCIEALALEDEFASRARGDVNKFIEYVILSDAGTRLRQSSLHTIGQHFIDKCFASKKNAGLLWPRDHGKTIQALGRMAFAIGRAHCTCIPGVSPGSTRMWCEADSITTDRVRSLKAIIGCERFQRVFPGVTWSQDRIDKKFSENAFNLAGHVLHDPNPSFFGSTLLTTVTGGRATLIALLDDVFGPKYLEGGEATRERVRRRIYDDVLNIIRCPVIFIGTMWSDSDQDVLTDMIRNPRWAWMIVSAEHAAITGKLEVTYKNI